MLFIDETSVCIQYVYTLPKRFEQKHMYNDDDVSLWSFYLYFQPGQTKCVEEGLKRNFTPAEVEARKNRIDILSKKV
jgi:hypothetical protein